MSNTDPSSEQYGGQQYGQPYGGQHYDGQPNGGQPNGGQPNSADDWGQVAHNLALFPINRYQRYPRSYIQLLPIQGLNLVIPINSDTAHLCYARLDYSCRTQLDLAVVAD